MGYSPQNNVLITLHKVLNDSNYFKKKETEKGDPGLVIVSLDGTTEVTLHSKNSPLITRPGLSSGKPEYLADDFQTKARDMKKGDEEILIRGWLMDDDTESAWNKLWKLRAMVTSGGPLDYFGLGNVYFPILLDKKSPSAWLVDVSGTLVSNDTGNPLRTWDFNNPGERSGPGNEVGRIEVSLKIILAKKR